MSNIIGYTTIDQPYTSSNLSDIDLAKRDLLNHFHIRKGEKWTDPEFGCDLPLYIFQPLDDITMDAIREEVYNVVNYDPRFTVNDTNIIVNQDAHYVTINVKLTYVPTTTAIDLQIKFDNEFQQDAEF
jgi:phage baseplate assembly protein W